MTVAHLIAPAPAGGAESVILALASAASDRSRVIVLNQVATGDDAAAPLSEQLRERGVTYDELRCGRRRYAAEVRAVAKLLRREAVSLLHTHGYHATVVGYFAAKAAGLPVVATVHGYLSRNAKERFYNVVDRFLLRRFDAVIAVSRQIAEQLSASGVPSSRVHVVQNGLSDRGAVLPSDRRRARHLLGVSETAPLVGWVGRLSPEKGADLLLDALAESDSTIQAVIVGDGAEAAALRERAARLGLSARTIFTGFRGDASALFPAFDVLALTSRREGTPMVLLEAVAAHVPIVAFRVGGIPDLLDDTTAWLVPPGSVSLLGEALRDALQSPERRAERAAAARRKIAEALSGERWLQRIDEVYRVALTTSPRMRTSSSARRDQSCSRATR